MRLLAATGVVGVALFAPKMTRLLQQFDRAKTNRTVLYGRISQAISRLEDAGMIAVSGTFRSRRISITKKGREKLHSFEFGEYQISEPAFWDGKWRVLMFDLSESRRRERDQLRHLLRAAGFVRIQDSVWVYPYPCDEFITLVRAHLRSGVGGLRSFVAEALESDAELRQHFKL